MASSMLTSTSASFGTGLSIASDCAESAGIIRRIRSLASRSSWQVALKRVDYRSVVRLDRWCFGAS